MGLFGGGAPGQGMSWQEKLAILGATLQDAGAGLQGNQGQALAGLQKMKAEQAKRQQQQAFLQDVTQRVRGLPQRQVERALPNAEGQDISAAFSPQMETRAAVPALNINSPELAGLALQADQLGVDLGTMLDVMKAQQPNIVFAPDNTAINSRDGSNVGRSFPKLGDGQMRGADGTVANAPGYVQSLAETEGAKTSAQEAAKAGYDLIDVNLNGAKVQLPRAVALPLLAQAFGLQNPGALQGNLPQGFGYTPPAAQLAADEMRSKAQAQGQIDLPGNLQTAQSTLGVIEQLKNHPGRRFGTGMTGVLPAMPGSETKDFVTLLEQAKGKTFLEAFAALKGGGQITEREGQAAQAALARLDRTQTEEGFLKALDELEGIVRGGMARSVGRAGVTPQAAPDRAAIAAELRRRGLIR